MFKIIGADGKEYGPISADQLRQWIAEGRVNAQTRIQEEGSTEWRTVGELSDFMPASTPPPGPTPAYTPPPGAYAGSVAGDRSRAQAMVNGPAIALLILGVLNIIFSLLNVLSLMGNRPTPSTGNPQMDQFLQSMQGTAGFVGVGIGVIVGIVIILGALKMKNLQSFGFAMTAAILAMIPCLSSCCILGIPLGIWALVVLNKPEVKSSFQ